MSNLNEVTKRIIGVLQRKYKQNNGNVLHEQDISKSDPIKDVFGLDSLDIIEVFMAIQDEFDVDIPDERYSELNSIEEISEFIIFNSPS